MTVIDVHIPEPVFIMLMQELGMTIIDVHIPELELMRIGHNVTILSEMQHNFAPQWAGE